MARYSSYSKKLVRKITDLIRSDSYTITEICDIVNISRASYYNWLDIKEGFAEAIEKAHDARMETFVAEAKKSLLKKVTGYTVQEKQIITVPSKEKDKNGKSKPRIKEQKITDKHYQPDTASIIFTLTNGDPERWRNRQHSEVTGKDGKDLIPETDLSRLSNDELKIYHELLSKAAKKDD